MRLLGIDGSALALPDYSTIRENSAFMHLVVMLIMSDE
jgi:hypothetical protein